MTCGVKLNVTRENTLNEGLLLGGGVEWHVLRTCLMVRVWRQILKSQHPPARISWPIVCHVLRHVSVVLCQDVDLASRFF